MLSIYDVKASNTKGFGVDPLNVPWAGSLYGPGKSFDRIRKKAHPLTAIISGSGAGFVTGGRAVPLTPAARAGGGSGVGAEALGGGVGPCKP